jgi:hypothetical protein
VSKPTFNDVADPRRKSADPPRNLLWHARPTAKFCAGITASLIRGFDTIALPYMG